MSIGYLIPGFYLVDTSQQRWDDGMEAHPASITPAPSGKVKFLCDGCKSTRTVAVLDQSSLHRNLENAYPCSISALKTKKAARVLQIYGFMCRGCALFHTKTNLKIAVTDPESKTTRNLPIARMFAYQGGQIQPEEPPLECLTHLSDDPRFANISSKSFEELEEIIKDNEIQTFDGLLEHVKPN